MIEFKCSMCGEGMEAPESLAGQSVKCPKCGALRRVPGQTRPAAPTNRGKPLLIGAVIVGVIAAAGVGGYLAMRQGPPKEARPKAAQEQGPAQNESELAQLRAENAQLKAKIAKAEAMPSPPPPVQAAPEPPSPPQQFAPTTAPPPVPKGVTLSGSAYVVRQGGQSDILRGFHVTLIQDTVSAEVLRNALLIVVQDYKSKASDKRKEAAKYRKESIEVLAKADDEDAKEFDGNAERYSQILAKVTGPADSAAALRLLGATCYVNTDPQKDQFRKQIADAEIDGRYASHKISRMDADIQHMEVANIREPTAEARKQVVRDFVESIQIATTTTDVQGAYKFTDAPTNAYIFAMFDTRDGFMMWAIPVQGSGSKDLFNDTALVSH